MDPESNKSKSNTEDQLIEHKTNSHFLTDRHKIDLSKIDDLTEEFSLNTSEDDGNSPHQRYSNLMKDHKFNFVPSKIFPTESQQDGATSRRETRPEMENKLDTSRVRKKRGIEINTEINGGSRQGSGFGLKETNRGMKESGFLLKDAPKAGSRADIQIEGTPRDEEGKSFIEPLTPSKSRRSLFDIMVKKKPGTSIDLTKDQLHLIEDKSMQEGPKKRFSLSLMGERKQIKSNKFLDAISRIAARREAQTEDEDNGASANIFAQALMKINPDLLKHAESDLRWKGLKAFIIKTRLFFRKFIKIYSPDDEITIFWTYLITIVVIFDVLWTPFELCFFLDDRNTVSVPKILTFLMTVFILDVIVNFRTSYYEKGIIVTSSKQVFQRYLKNEFWIDFIAIVSEVIGSVFYSGDGFFIKYFKIFRTWKLYALIQKIEDFLNVSRSIHATFKLIRLWMTIVLVGHWIACLFHLVAQTKVKEAYTWLDANNLVDASIFERYVGAFYWAVTTMTTVGYGDVGAVSGAERIYSCAAMLVACVLFGYTMNVIGDILNEMTADKNLVNEKMRSVKAYMAKKNLGRDLQIRVKNYLQYMIDSKNYHKNEEEELFKLLSQSLKDDIISEVNGKTLIDCKIFRTHFTQKCSMHLSRMMEEKFLVPEEILFTERIEDYYNCIYFIQYGKINLFLGGKMIATIEQGNCVGEIEFFTEGPRSATARSHLFTTLFYLNRDYALETIKYFPSDFEQFHSINCNVLINKNLSQLEISCFTCHNRGHIARECPKLHYVADKTMLIQDYLYREARFRISFKRNNRTKLSFRKNFKELARAAAMIQEDYEDPSASEDDNLSQDSLDEILERNLVAIPGAEIEDQRKRRADPRRKSLRTQHHRLTNEENTSRLRSLMTGENNRQSGRDKEDNEEQDARFIQERVFFTIDKVENFEVYFPHNNIQRLIQDFEKKRIERLEQSPGGKFKAQFLKNMNAFKKARSPRTPRIKSIIINTVPVLNRIKADMERITRQKKERRTKWRGSSSSVSNIDERGRTLVPEPRFTKKVDPVLRSRELSSEIVEDSPLRRHVRDPSIETSSLMPPPTNKSTNLNFGNSRISIQVPSQSRYQNSSLLPSSINNDPGSHNKVTNSIKLNQLSVSEVPVNYGDSLNNTPGEFQGKNSGKAQGNVLSFQNLNILSPNSNKSSVVDTGKKGELLFSNLRNLRIGANERSSPDSLTSPTIIAKRMKANRQSFEDALVIQLIRKYSQRSGEGTSKYNRSASYSKMIQMRFLVDKLKLDKLTYKITQEVRSNSDLRLN